MTGRTPRAVIVFVILAAGQLGCTSPWMRSKSEEKAVVNEKATVRLVRDMTRPWGLRPTTIEGIGLITQLANTGSDPPTSAGRDLLLEDMRVRSVESPASILGSPNTSLAMVRAVLPAGVRKGDRLDLEVRTPTNSETTSLRQGWLMPTRMQEMAVLGNRIRRGRLMGMSSGAVLVDALLENDSDPRFETKGRILGGAVSNVSRDLGLVLTTEHHSVRASSMIGNAVNARFHTYDRGTKRGVATPKRDDFIELSIHRSYGRNLLRYVRVVQAIPVRESSRQRIERLGELEAKLMDEKTALSAAVDLEAIGAEAMPILRNGLSAPTQLVRFAAAEAMAYMNEIDAIPILLEAARNEPALRWHSLTALSAMTESEARDALVELMHEPSDETRYGAFKALIDFNPRDPAAHGEILGDVMALHTIASNAEPLVHVRKTERPEVVLFGKSVKLNLPAVVYAGENILIKSDSRGRLKVNYFTMADDDRTHYCDNDLADLIRTIVRVGGGYTDVVSAINHAKQKDTLNARIKFDAIPQPGRKYAWDEIAEDADDEFADDDHGEGDET